ncbi:SCN11A, partial [Symbiodinium pilosum]
IEPMVLRIARLARLLRLIRLVRAIQGFDALYILTTSLKGSLTVVFWSFILIFVVQMAIGFILNQYLLGHMENEELDMAVR